MTSTTATDNLTANKHLAVRFLDLISDGDIAALTALISPTWTMEGGPPDLPAGREGLRVLFDHIGGVRQRWTIDDVLAEGDKVVVRATNHFEQDSFFGRPAAGSTVRRSAPTPPAGPRSRRWSSPTPAVAGSRPAARSGRPGSSAWPPPGRGGPRRRRAPAAGAGPALLRAGRRGRRAPRGQPTSARGHPTPAAPEPARTGRRSAPTPPRPPASRRRSPPRTRAGNGAEIRAERAQQRLLDLRGDDRQLLDDLPCGRGQPVHAGQDGVDDGPRHRVVRRGEGLGDEEGVAGRGPVQPLRVDR